MCSNVKLSEGKPIEKGRGMTYKMTNEAWIQAKKEIKKLGIEINTRVKSCELGCACVGDNWAAKSDKKPTIWQTGKRFSSKYGGYLNHQKLSDTHKWQIMAILNANGIEWRWDGESHHTIKVTFKQVTE